MKIKVTNFDNGLCAFGLEAEPPPGGDLSPSFFTLHASSFGAEATLFLRAEDIRALYETLGGHLFNEGREIQE